ncbi:MAG TPA: ATP-binding protein [Candidatus Sulfotelmatobacter sp.]|nr:ATP-binding protein [Candidatus Sulfotelmatobacter sp.]
MSDSKKIKTKRPFASADAGSFREHLTRAERKQWWLSFSSVAVTLILTVGIVSFSVVFYLLEGSFWERLNFNTATEGLIGLVLVFVIYVVYQQWQIHRFRLHLLAQEELFHLIGENAVDMIAVVTVDGRRLYNSPSYEKVLGYSAEELEQASAFEHIHSDDLQAVRAASEEARVTGVARGLEYRMRHKNGEWRVLESTASAVRDSSGKVEKLVIVNRDVTERHELQEQLVLSQRLEAVGKLSGGIAHDFNNLLGVIIGYSDALQQSVGPDDPLREPIDEIRKAGQRAAALTQQLLAFSRKQVLEPKILDLNAIILDMEKMLRRLIGEDVVLKFNVRPGLGNVKADRGQLEQVVLNLAVNARDAMPRGGELCIEAENRELTEADKRRYRYVVPGRYTVLTVSDTGTGMDAETQSHIFEPFFTTKEKGKGTGLGLATVYGIVKQSGGYIWLNSAPGEGSTFRIFLPVVAGVVEQAPSEPTSGSPSAGVRTILLAEDEDSLRKLARTMLEKAGYRVLEASDASEALQIAADAALPIDLLLTDVIMPGMSGGDLAKKLSPQRPEMHILFMSGYTDGAIETQGNLKPGLVVLRKPFTRDILLRAVEDALLHAPPSLAALEISAKHSWSTVRS